MTIKPGGIDPVVAIATLVIKSLIARIRSPLETHEKWMHAFRIGAKRGGFAEAVAIHFGGSLTDPV
jgi:hypothetical protein